MCQTDQLVGKRSLLKLPLHAYEIKLPPADTTSLPYVFLVCVCVCVALLFLLSGDAWGEVGEETLVNTTVHTRGGQYKQNTI